MRLKSLIPAAALLLAACLPSDPWEQWVRTWPDVPGLSGTRTFTLRVYDEVGNADFVHDGLVVGDSADLYMIVLDAFSPGQGSTVQIREMDGDRTGRIVFRAIPDTTSAANLRATVTFDSTSTVPRIELEWLGETGAGTVEVYNKLAINRTLYLNFVLRGASVTPPDPCLADLEAPQIAMNVLESTLWPPNGQMVRVASGIVATDNLDSLPMLDVSVTSSNPITGAGDTTSPDWIVERGADGAFDVWVRAERRPPGGRTYTITATSTDRCGNGTSTAHVVTVPHNQGRGK